MTDSRPLIAITMGDPAGIGSELCVKVLSDKDVYRQCKPLIIGDSVCISDALRFTNRRLDIHTIDSPKKGIYEFGAIDIMDLGMVDFSRFRYGEISEMCGRAAGAYIKKAIDLAMNNEVDANVTNPVHKESFKLGGWGKKYAGHTEMYADLSNSKKYTMMLANGNFRTVHVSTHVSLLKAIELVKKERILGVIQIAHDACKSLGIEVPKIAVAGLNPHAGENGLFGTEEIDEIIPAINEAKSLGYNVEGPISGDTIFSKARGGWYDVVVSMYHDQGHSPMKLVGFVFDQDKKQWTSVSGVNITLGLPIIRVSVDHGTAFGKAGKGEANETSLKEAIEYAVKFANTKKNNKI